jgi:hypothetical protein
MMVYTIYIHHSNTTYIYTLCTYNDPEDICILGISYLLLKRFNDSLSILLYCYMRHMSLFSSLNLHRLCLKSFNMYWFYLSLSF